VSSDDYVPPTMAQLLDGFDDEIERAAADAAGRNKGGQQCGIFSGDFARCPPSTYGRLRWWSKAFRAALEEKK